MPRRPTLLYVTGLAYQARGRRYCDEDVFTSSSPPLPGERQGPGTERKR
jgi:hypothetical protein